MNYLKPKDRSKLRIALGKKYFTLKRYIKWYKGDKRYSKGLKTNKLPFVVFNHKTPLYRDLKNLEDELQINKVTNLKLALKRINGIVIKPKETFSYWKLIKKPTKRKGYKDGLILHYGKLKKGIGGGLCQLSNLIYWMVLHSPLEVTERYRHSYDVFPDCNRKQPFGSGATCVYNYRDLQFINNTDCEFQLYFYLTEKYLIGEIRSNEKNIYNYEVYQKKHKITHEPWGGYIRHNLIYKRIYDINKNLIDDEYVTENHAIMMYKPFLTDEKKIK